MINIDKETELYREDVLYNPKSQNYYQIEDIGFNEIFKEVIVNLKPENNFEERGFTIRFSGLIYLKYQVVLN